MANGYFERGEIYWVRVDTGVGVETGVGRPGLIVSNNTANNTAECVSIAWMTTQTKTFPWDIITFATGKRSFIMCNQITTVDKSRLGKCIGNLSPEEIKRVDAALEEQFDLGYVDDAALKEKETEIAARNVQIKELKEEIVKLQAEIAARDNDATAVKVEIAMWQRLYEKALDQLCNMKLTGDISRRVEKKAPVVVETAATVETVAPVEDEPKLVDINTAKFDELRACGFSNNIALSIINRRPHKSVESLKNIPGVTSTLYQIVSKKVCCTAQPEAKRVVSALVEPDVGYEADEKVNINTATAKELKEKLGINECYAYTITGYRKKNGRFVSLEELKEVKGIPAVFYDRYKDRLTIGGDEPHEPEEPTPDTGKVNVNTVKSAANLANETGMSMRCASAVVSHRKKNGPYEKVEDLLKVDGFGQIAMRRYGHLLEV